MSGADVRDHIERGLERVFTAAARLNNPELTMLYAIWATGDAQRRDLLWAVGKARIRRTKRGGLMAAARSQLAEWTNAGQISVAAGSAVGIDLQHGGDTGTIRRQAMPALLDAALAVVAADGLSDCDRAFLMQPLRSVTESKKGLRV